MISISPSLFLELGHRCCEEQHLSDLWSGRSQTAVVVAEELNRPALLSYIYYHRCKGSQKAPVLVLLHGFPDSTSYFEASEFNG